MLSELQLPSLSMSETARIFAKLNQQQQHHTVSSSPQQRLNQANNSKLNKPPAQQQQQQQQQQRRHSSCDHRTATKIIPRPRTTSDKTETLERSQETKLFILDEIGVQKVDNLKVKVKLNEFMYAKLSSE